MDNKQFVTKPNNRVRELREAKGWTQRQLAEATVLIVLLWGTR